MTMPQPGQPPTPSPGEPQEDMMPTVLELQKLLLERLKGAGRPGRTLPDEVAVVSITSCNSYSCR